MKTWLCLLSLVALGLAGCAAPTRYVDPGNDQGAVSMQLDYRDFNKAADKAVASMLASGAVDNPAGGALCAGGESYRQ